MWGGVGGGRGDANANFWDTRFSLNVTHVRTATMVIHIALDYFKKTSFIVNASID